MNVIDVTPRPAVVSAAVRFLQSPFMSILGIIFIFTALKWGTLLFVVPQYETVIITRFGKIVRTITTPGLKVKLPLIDKLQRFDKRILAWDGPPTECPTKDKLYIIVDCFARWRISDPMLYYNRLNDERSALSRLDDILGSETRTAVATHDLVEIIRVTKGRKPVRDEELEKTGTVLPTTIPDIEFGRGEIEKQITERTRQKIADFGIELLDERFKRSKYNPAVAEKIIERMSSERHQIAARFRSEGRGEAANISGQKESDVASISSNATKAKPTPKPRRFTPQLLARLTSRNSIRFCAASMSCAPRLKRTRRWSCRPTAISAECSNRWPKPWLRKTRRIDRPASLFPSARAGKLLRSPLLP